MFTQKNGKVLCKSKILFTNAIKYADTPLAYNMMLPAVDGEPANFFINTGKYFSKFEICQFRNLLVR